MYYKILNRNLTSNNYQFVLGLNINSTNSLEFLFERLKYILRSLDFNSVIADVEFPADSKVQVVHKTNENYYTPVVSIFEDRVLAVKADKIILKNVRPIRDFIISLTPEELATALKYIHTNILCYIPDLPEELQLRVIKCDYTEFRWIAKSATREFTLRAIAEKPFIIRFIKKQTPELCFEAIKRDGSAISYVIHKTKNMILTAIRGGKDKSVSNYCCGILRDCLKPVEHKKYINELIREAIKINWECLSYLDYYTTPDILLYAVQTNWRALQLIKKEKQTVEMCEEALKQNEGAKQYVKIVLPERNCSVSKCIQN